MKDKIRILGCPLIPVNEVESRAEFQGFLNNRSAGYCIAINAEKIMRYGTDRDFKDIVDNSIFPYPDGFGATFASKVLAGIHCQKINMPYLCIEEADRAGVRLFIYGASPENHDLAISNIRLKFPNLNLVGHCHGYVDSKHAFMVIKEARPAVVLIALGSPQQEKFSAENFAEVRAIFVGGGGSLDIFAGVKKRAPSFFVDNGLEWFYRLVKEPWRWRRQLKLLGFFRDVLKARIGQIGMRSP